MDLSIPAIAERVTDEASAYEFLEELRWGGTPVCPHCGVIGEHYFLTPKSPEGRQTRTGKVSQRRVWKCRDCRKQFTVLVGTIFHGSKIPVKTWLFVVFEMCASKNGVAAREIQRKYKMAPKSAWFMTQRIREAMKVGSLAGLLRGTVIADETFIGGDPKNRHRKQRWQEGYAADHKTPVLALVNRDTGEVRSQVVPNVRGKTLRAAIVSQVDLPNSHLHTDSHQPYIPIGWSAKSHGRVNHSMSEYVRDGITTNHAEGYFSQLKRSLDGTHHGVSVEHLPRYLAEFDFRYSTHKMSDSQRMARLVGQVAGRRLTYRAIT